MVRSRKITPLKFHSLNEIPNSPATPSPATRSPATRRPSLYRRFRHPPSSSERPIHIENLLQTDAGQIILNQLENEPRSRLAQTASKLKRKINEDNKSNELDNYIEYILRKIKHKIEPRENIEFEKINNLKKLAMNNLIELPSKYQIAVAGAGYLKEDGTISLKDGNIINAKETLQLFRKNKIMMYKTGVKQYYFESEDYPSSIAILNNHELKNMKNRILNIKRQIWLLQQNLISMHNPPVTQIVLNVFESVQNEKRKRINQLKNTLQGLENKIKNSTKRNAIYQNLLKKYRSNQLENSKRIPIYSTYQHGRRTNVKTYGKMTEKGVYFMGGIMNDNRLLERLKRETVKFDPMHVVVIRKKNESPDNIPLTSLVYGSIGYKFYKGHHRNNRTRLYANFEKIGSLGEHEIKKLINEGMVFYSPLMSTNSKLTNINPEKTDFTQIFGKNFLKKKGLSKQSPVFGDANMWKVRNYVINLKYHPLMEKKNKTKYNYLLFELNRKMVSLAAERSMGISNRR